MHSMVAIPKLSTEHYHLLARLQRPLFLTREEIGLAQDLFNHGLIAKGRETTLRRFVLTSTGEAVLKVIG